MAGFFGHMIETKTTTGTELREYTRSILCTYIIVAGFETTLPRLSPGAGSAATPALVVPGSVR